MAGKEMGEQFNRELDLRDYYPGDRGKDLGFCLDDLTDNSPLIQGLRRFAALRHLEGPVSDILAAIMEQQELAKNAGRKSRAKVNLLDRIARFLDYFRSTPSITVLTDEWSAPDYEGVKVRHPERGVFKEFGPYEGKPFRYVLTSGERLRYVAFGSSDKLGYWNKLICPHICITAAITDQYSTVDDLLAFGSVGAPIIELHICNGQTQYFGPQPFWNQVGLAVDTRAVDTRVIECSYQHDNQELFGYLTVAPIPTANRNSFEISQVTPVYAHSKKRKKS